MPFPKQKLIHYLIHQDGLVMRFATTADDLENHEGIGRVIIEATKLDKAIFHVLELNRKGSADCMDTALTETQYQEAIELFSNL